MYKLYNQKHYFEGFVFVNKSLLAQIIQFNFMVEETINTVLQTCQAMSKLSRKIFYLFIYFFFD